MIVVEDPDFTLHQGDVRDVLPMLEPESVDCALTSPPFYALRDYGVDGQIGLEASPEEWAEELTGVFRSVRRLLKPQGTLWVECGDSYAGNPGGPQGQTGQRADRAFTANARTFRPGSGRANGIVDERGQRNRNGTGGVQGYKPKDLLGTPWLLAFALRADGWWLRQAIVWHKPNAMPESVTDRCTTAHSYVFLLSKSARYHFDAEAIAEPAEWARWGDQTVPKYERTDTASGWMQPKTKNEIAAEFDHRRPIGQKWELRRIDDIRTMPVNDGSPQKNARSVWTIPTQGYPDAHFATWPEALVERIIKAGCPEGGTVLDPFMGSGTTALIARRLGRKAIGVEINADYCAMAARRLQQLSLLA